MIKASDIRQKYLKFFESRGHKIIPSAPLIPENDPTTLFTSSGMQPLISNLLGQPHPSGNRLVNSQKCFRSQDIEEVGDNRHTTFFEMLGNWSLGDYFKQEQLSWFHEFLTKELDLPKDKLYVSVFEGDKFVPKDDESADIWEKLGIPKNRIFYYGVKKNWWSRAGEPENMPTGEPGGPDSEVFYEFAQIPHNPKFGDHCHPNCDCGRFLEIGNSVFMQYQKQSDGLLIELPQKNVDFGGGLERLEAASRNDPDVFKTSLITPIIEAIEKTSEKTYSSNLKETRTIADHLRAATFISNEGVIPSKEKQGYLLRRLIRNSYDQIYEKRSYNSQDSTTTTTSSQNQQWKVIKKATESVIQTYKNEFGFERLFENQAEIISSIYGEVNSYENTINTTTTTLLPNAKTVSGKMAFDLHSTHGLSPEQLLARGYKFSREEYEEEFKKHQELSRTTSRGMFKGGLQDHSEITTKYHTATHLLHQALRDVLGTHVQQKGSNITSQRLRFDFSHPDKLTSPQIDQIENLINQKIAENLPVTKVEMPKAQALTEGALAFFPEKYPDTTSVYLIGDYSKELCGGPHVNSTGEIGRIKITKEESAGSGVRRIYAQLPTP